MYLSSNSSSSPSTPQRLSPTLHAPGFLIDPITCMTGAVDIEGPAAAAMWSAIEGWPAIEGRLRPQWGVPRCAPDFEVDATMHATAEARDGVFATGVGGKDECQKAPTGDEGKVGEGGGDSATEDAVTCCLAMNLQKREKDALKMSTSQDLQKTKNLLVRVDPEGVPNTHGVERAVSGCGVLDMVLMATAGAKGRDASHSSLLFMSSKTNPYNMEDLHRGERYCSFDFMIPKLHSYTHHAICQYDYSCTRTRQTDGESVERTWAVISKAYMGKPEGAFQRESCLRNFDLSDFSVRCRLVANSLRGDRELVTATSANCTQFFLFCSSNYPKLKRQFRSLRKRVKSTAPSPSLPRSRVAMQTGLIDGSTFNGDFHNDTNLFEARNEDELREKARVRMATLALRRRQAIKDSGQLADEAAAGIKQAHTKYRDKNRDYLKFKARLRCQEAFIANHGVKAHRKRIAEERARDDAAWAANSAAR
ncbi:hypothetical protein B0H14DRAFT_2637200 [Mycena olivaceomarginata]|nr:hypothetical protein B0H14DRAFT_2637200 [Mycena olivaceomarginata]